MLCRDYTHVVWHATQKAVPLQKSVCKVSFSSLAACLPLTYLHVAHKRWDQCPCLGCMFCTTARWSPPVAVVSLFWQQIFKGDGFIVCRQVVCSRQVMLKCADELRFCKCVAGFVVTPKQPPLSGCKQRMYCHTHMRLEIPRHHPAQLQSSSVLSSAWCHTSDVGIVPNLKSNFMSQHVAQAGCKWRRAGWTRHLDPSGLGCLPYKQHRFGNDTMIHQPALLP